MIERFDREHATADGTSDLLAQGDGANEFREDR